MMKLFAAILTGAFIGIGIYTFHYAEGFSYLSSDPQVCANSHIMKSQLDSWQKSSHHKAALCVDCHLPHDFLNKYIAKAENGRRHSIAFTLENFHEPIEITKANSDILQDNCIRCHKSMVENLVMIRKSQSNGISCVHCHNGVGHGERVGLGRMIKN